MFRITKIVLFALMFCAEFCSFHTSYSAEVDKLNKEIIGKFQKWTALTATPDGNKVCYAVIYSSNRIGNYEKSDTKPYFMVHYFGIYKERISVFFDYNTISGSNVFLSIDGKQFVIHPNGNYAISPDSETDVAIIAALQSGKKLLIRAEGEGGKYTVDEYQISGFSKTYQTLKSKCN